MSRSKNGRRPEVRAVNPLHFPIDIYPLSRMIVASSSALTNACAGRNQESIFSR